MKKMFAASLVAIMAVSAANAEIASVSYVDREITTATGDLDTLATTAKSNLTAAVNELAGKITDTGSDATDAINAAKTELQGSIDAVDDKADANADAIAALDNTYATDTALNDGLALKQDKAKMLNTLDGFSGNTEEYYPTVDLMETYVATTNNAVMDAVADNTAAISAINNAETGILKQAQTYADQAESDAISAAGTAADGKIAAALESYSTTTEMNTAIKNANDAQTTTITNAYTAADSALESTLKQYADDAAAGASGEAGEVASDLADYIQSNNTAVNAAKAQADKGVEDAAAAKAAADAAQADADANAAAIAGLDSTYVKDSDFSTFQTSNTSAIATAKSEAIAAAKEAGDAAYDAKGAAAAAQTAAVDAAKTAADATYQVKSSALSVGAAGGAWTDLTTVTGYSATGTHSLVLKNGNIQWEAVRYAE